MTAVVAVDIGGTGLSLASVNRDGVMSERVDLPSPVLKGGPAVVRTIAQVVSTTWPGAPVGVGTAGVIDPVTGAITAASDSFRDWAGFPLRAALEDELAVPVVVENDVNSYLMGECRFGSLAGRRDALGLMLGTGVGGALLLDGRLRVGPRGGAGEFGHMPGFGTVPCTCGEQGHLEGWAGGRSIARRYEEALSRAGHAGEMAPVHGAREVAEAAHRGDEQARTVLYEAGFNVGLAIVMAAVSLDIDAAVIGGGVARSWDLVSAGIDDALEHNRVITGVRPQVLRSKLGGDAVLLGAAALAWDAATSVQG